MKEGINAPKPKGTAQHIPFINLHVLGPTCTFSYSISYYLKRFYYFTFKNNEKNKKTNKPYL